MGELRKDPITGRWVIIATERQARPHDFASEPQPIESRFCPFCEGHEDKTPPEIAARRSNGSGPNQPGWQVRVVPNKFPALGIEGELRSQGIGVYDAMSGIGAHEVIIETPRHEISLTGLDAGHVFDVLGVYRDRLSDLKQDVRFDHALLFKNVGKAAGASLEHTHSQLIATPIVPIRVAEEMRGAATFHEYRGRCIWCDIIEQELGEGRRVIYENEDMVVVAPFASRFPFEACVLPRRHASRFEETDDSGLRALTDALLQVLGRLEKGLQAPPYNYMIHSAPFRQPPSPSYHWHIEITPRLTKVAGFEWGSGFYINPVPPEEAVRFLRAIRFPVEEAA
jgi:UDPglucose--hexose-1-phosphate uridylyltransferase